MIKLRDKVRDTITGYTGIVIARTEWLNGCVRATIQAQELKDGKPIESQTFDVQQLEIVEQHPAAAEPKRTGGPFPEPSRQADPVR